MKSSFVKSQISMINWQLRLAHKKHAKKFILLTKN
nr:hypothetical protein [Delftia sp. PE138]